MTEPAQSADAPPTETHSPQGRAFDLGGGREIAERAIELAFDYRGDVTLTLRDGRRIEGYLFDRRRDARGRLVIRVMLTEGGRVSLDAEEVRLLAFTGRDTAAGKSWETWVRQYAQRLASDRDAAAPPTERE